MEINIEEILKMADELGIEYEIDSANPGFFIATDNGEGIEEVSIEEILLIDSPKRTNYQVIDGTISKELKKNVSTKTIQVSLDEEFYFYPVKAKGVA